MNILMAEQPSIHRPAAILIFARMASVVVVLLTTPILIHFLGGDGFAAWAILLATGAAFTALEVGMGPTFIQHAAPLIQRQDWRGAGELLASAWCILAGVFALGALVLCWFAPFAARQLQLPATPLLSASALLWLIYAAVALRSLLQFGAWSLHAARRFQGFAAASLLQSLSSNLAAAAVAVLTRRLDLSVIAYWLAQVLSVGLVFVLLRSSLFRKSLALRPSGAKLRELLPHGMKVQLYDWSQIISYQFDKFLIATLIGLWGVAPYEVANRSVLALRSMPSSALDSFLPSAAIGQDEPEENWQRYLSVTRMASLATMAFMLAPLAIAPVFLYAWTGQMGYLSSGVFVGLSVGFIANVLVLPASAMVQSAGRANIQARSAVATMLINVPLSLLLLFKWGMVGAAIGTSVAMVVGSVLLLVQMHRAYGRPLRPTIAIFAQFWPALLVCLAFATLGHYAFEHWLAGIHGDARFAWRTRVVPALLSALGYALCLGTMLTIQMRRGMLGAQERAQLVDWWRARAGFSRWGRQTE
jgi:O-antigen/teichoic acid export membrane protein